MLSRLAASMKPHVLTRTASAGVRVVRQLPAALLKASGELFGVDLVTAAAQGDESNRQPRHSVSLRSDGPAWIVSDPGETVPRATASLRRRRAHVVAPLTTTSQRARCCDDETQPALGREERLGMPGVHVLGEHDHAVMARDLKPARPIHGADQQGRLRGRHLRDGRRGWRRRCRRLSRSRRRSDVVAWRFAARVAQQEADECEDADRRERDDAMAAVQFGLPR